MEKSVETETNKANTTDITGIKTGLSLWFQTLGEKIYASKCKLYNQNETSSVSIRMQTKWLLKAKWW